MNKYRNGDVVRWEWNAQTLKKMDLKKQAGTLYWCQSRIAIFNEKSGRFSDTYWNSSDKFSFDLDYAKEKIHLVDVANLDELEECRKEQFNYYDQCDCINLSHPNMTRGGFYIKKSAVKSLPKMKQVIEAHIEYYNHQAKSALRVATRLSEDLENITLESYLPCNEDVLI